MSTENSPRLYIFPHHLLRSRTVGGTPVGSHSDKHGVRKKNRPTLVYTRQAASSADHAGVRVRHGNRLQNRELHRIFGTVVHDLNPVFGKKPDISGRHNSYVSEAVMAVTRGLQKASCNLSRRSQSQV